jgi:hypothetical protein
MASPSLAAMAASTNVSWLRSKMTGRVSPRSAWITVARRARSTGPVRMTINASRS